MAKKIKYIEAVGYAIVGNSGGPATPLEPGGRVAYNDEIASHKAIAAEIDSGVNTTLRIVDVDPEAEAAAEKEKQKLLKKAEEISAKQQLEQQQSEQRAAGEGIYDPTDDTVANVLAYLKQASPEEVDRVKELEADSKRGSKQVADFEAPSAGAPDEGDPGASGTEGSEGTSPGQNSADDDAGGAGS